MIRINYDALGIAASVACAIHCAILPLVLSSLPLFGINIINNPSFEILMIGLAFLIGVYSLWHGYRKHHHKIYPVLMFATGMGLMLLKQFYHKQFMLFLLPAVALIVLAHVFNFTETRKTNRCDLKGCTH